MKDSKEMINLTEQKHVYSPALFSLVLLCYENVSLLMGMVETILSQDYPNIELIISDDGSSDFSCEEVRAEIDQRMKERKNCSIRRLIVRKNEKNIKTVQHVHQLLPMTSGDYVVLTAADDRFDNPHILSDYVQVFQKNPDSLWIVARAKIVSSDYKRTIHSLPSEEDIPFFASQSPRVLFSRWCRRGMAIPCCMAFRKEAFELAGGIDTTYTYLEDWPLVLHLLLKGYMPLYLNQYAALHSMGGITNTNVRYGVERRRVFFADKYRLLDTLTEPNLSLLSPKDVKAYRCYRHEIMDRNYFLQIDVPTADKKTLLKSVLKKPIKLFWLAEEAFWEKSPKLHCKKLLAASHGLIAFFIFFTHYAQTGSSLALVIGFLGWIDVIAGLSCMVLAFGSGFMKLLCQRKRRLRRLLVN